MAELTPLEAGRKTEEAFKWAEQTIGGKIIHKERQPRWRPHWFLDIQKPDGTIVKTLMRGWRAPYAEDERGTRDRLRMEAEFSKALQGTGVKLPRYYGYEPDGGWFLQEYVTGSPFISEVEDLKLQHKIFREYIENIALMHSLDPAQLDLPKNIPICRTYEEGIRHNHSAHRAMYDNYPDKDPEPLFTLCDWWLSTHKPKPVERFSVTTGDIGVDQFMFENGEFKTIFDLDWCYVGDPLQDVCLMRLKNMAHGSAKHYLHDLPDHIRHWAKTLGRELDKTSVAYWTIAGMVFSPMIVYANWVKPNPTIIGDVAHLNSFIPIHRRGICEAFAEFYDFQLTPPERPKPVSDRMTRYAELVVGQIREYHVPHAEDQLQLELKATAAFAEAVLLGNTIGPEIIRQNVSDLSNVLGYQPTDERTGLAALQERIRKDPEKDMEKVIRALYKIECRNEFLLSPMQAFTNYPSGMVLQRLW